MVSVNNFILNFFIKTNLGFYIFPGDIEIKMLKLVHNLIPPVISQISLNDGKEGATKPRSETNKDTPKKIYKFSIIDSIKSMILILEHGEQYKPAIAAYAAEKKRIGLHFHPLMVVLKDKKETPSKFLLFFNGKTVILPNFAALLQCYLKSFYVFNFEFPGESKHICYFLAKYFFNFPVPKIPGITGIQKILEFLN